MAKHILVIEDNPAYCRLVRRMLEIAGFSVTTAADFNAAIAIIEGHERLDLLVADVNLPSGTPSGLSTGMMAVRRRPELKILYMTGADDPTGFPLFAPDAPILRKPFTSSELVASVKKALGEV